MDINSALQTSKALLDEEKQKQTAFLRYVVLLFSTLFGILISLQTKIPIVNPSRVFLGLAEISLALGILTGIIALYSEVFYAEEARQRFADEAQTAVREHRDIGAIFGKKRAFFVVCEKSCYISFTLAVLMLTAYSLMSVFG